MKKNEPEDEQICVSSMHDIKKQHTNPLDNSYKEIKYTIALKALHCLT